MYNGHSCALKKRKKKRGRGRILEFGHGRKKKKLPLILVIINGTLVRLHIRWSDIKISWSDSESVGPMVQILIRLNCGQHEVCIIGATTSAMYVTNNIVLNIVHILFSSLVYNSSTVGRKRKTLSHYLSRKIIIPEYCWRSCLQFQHDR